MNAKQKGSSFERQLSRELSLWWTGGKRKDAIWRSASSGGLATVHRGSYQQHVGDFTATDEEARPLFERFIIEAKRGYNRCSFQDLLDLPEKSKKNHPFTGMMQTLLAACRDSGKYGLLLWKRDRRLTLALVIRPWAGVGMDPFDSMFGIDFPLADKGGGPKSAPVYCLGMPWSSFQGAISAAWIKSMPEKPAVWSV